MEVRAWSGAGCWWWLLPGAGVGQVEPAGAAQRLLGRAHRQAAWQHRVLVAVLAGQVDGEPPQAGRAGIPQPAQREQLAALELTVDVGEAATEPHLDAGERWPALASLGAEPLAERGLGRLGDGLGHQDRKG